MRQYTIVTRCRPCPCLPGGALKIRILAHAAATAPIIATDWQVITCPPDSFTGTHITIIHLQMCSTDRDGVDRTRGKCYHGNMRQALREGPTITTTDED